MKSALVVMRRTELGKGEPRGRQATEKKNTGASLGRVFSWNLIVWLKTQSLVTQGPQIGVFPSMWI